jgi:uncharacterized pyridoxamine 5'-phosphate oxidase family protein
MSLQDCITFANENPMCFIATVEKDQPRVRAMVMWFADESGFYFHTASNKALCRQLDANPRVEACYHKPGTPPDPGTMMRVTGTVKLLEDTSLQTRLLRERPFLEDVKKYAPEGSRLVVFRITGGEAHFWTMSNNTHEDEIKRIKF